MRQPPTITLTLLTGHPLTLKAKAVEEVVSTDTGSRVITGNGEKYEVEERYEVVCLMVRNAMEGRDAS